MSSLSSILYYTVEMIHSLNEAEPQKSSSKQREDNFQYRTGTVCLSRAVARHPCCYAVGLWWEFRDRAFRVMSLVLPLQPRRGAWWSIARSLRWLWLLRPNFNDYHLKLICDGLRYQSTYLLVHHLLSTTEFALVHHEYDQAWYCCNPMEGSPWG